MEDKHYTIDDKNILKNPPPPITTIYIGNDMGLQIGVDKKFSWFQKMMIEWCFGFTVKEN